VEFSWITWFVSVGAVLASGLAAWRDGNLTKRAGLDMGFANHGGMWGDLLLLPIANAAIVPHLRSGVWVVASLIVCSILSAWVHVHWYRDEKATAHRQEHMWPSRQYRSWWRDLSWAGWAHVAYVAVELSILIGCALFPMPAVVIAVVAVVLSLHVPLGLLQPRWFLTGEIATARKQPLLIPCLAAVWVAALVKIV
jgi:hypothetical protein